MASSERLMTRFLYCVLLQLVAATSWTQTPRFVPGDVMARFVPGSEYAKAVSQAAGRDPVDVSALAPLANRLAEAAGVPLRPVGIHSGGFCLLSVDGAALRERLRQRLAGRPRVERAEVVPDSVGIAVRVTYAAGAEEARLPRARLAGTLESELGVPLKVESPPQGGLLVRVNLENLTLKLVEKLKALPGVESVQPNYLVRRMGR